MTEYPKSRTFSQHLKALMLRHKREHRQLTERQQLEIALHLSGDGSAAQKADKTGLSVARIHRLRAKARAYDPVTDYTLETKL